MGIVKRLFTQAQMGAQNKACGRCGQGAVIACNECGRPLCEECPPDDCGEVLCVACGDPINADWDIDFEDEGGGMHRRCN